MLNVSYVGYEMIFGLNKISVCLGKQDVSENVRLQSKYCTYFKSFPYLKNDEIKKYFLSQYA